jgi:hypothetical protein
MARHKTRATLDAGARLALEGFGNSLKPMTTRQITWNFGEMQVQGLLCLLRDSGFLTLHFEGQDQRIDVVSIPRNFGGRQWYLRCPVTGVRVSVLWKPLGALEFASRHAFGNAGYHSQSISTVDRAWRIKRKVARRLGSDDPADHDLQPKPKWMRKHTYKRLVARYVGAHSSLMRDFDAKAPALFEKLGIKLG